MGFQVKIKYVNDMAKKPFYATEGAAGMDLSAAISEPVILKKGNRVLIPTGIAIALPSAESVAYIYARSGLGIKKGICLSNGVGVIDSDYRGEICVGLINLGDEDYTIEPGERIAQMVFAPVLKAEFVECESLEETERGAGGFGSTGR
ncbi:MAG: dUTP diphosphatase [Clostridia bacterium]|nr:dUTP diphosphatase [Clostridia bacterium]